jgi:PAS domain S-box-containing protein
MKKQPGRANPEKKKPKNPAGIKKVREKATVPLEAGYAMDWEAVFRAIGSPAIMVAPDHSILSANDATCRMTGKTEAEIRGRKCWEVFHGPDATRPPQGCPMVRLLSSGKHETAEMEVAMNGGVCLVSCTPVIDAGGTVSSIIHIATDITEKKKNERILLENEERFRQIFLNSPLGMALVTPDFRFLSVNPSWVSMTGYSEKELLEMSFKDITHPDHLAGDLEHMLKLAAGKITVYATEKRYIRKDRSILWGLLKVTAIRDHTGSLRHFAAQIEDITGRKRLENLIRASETRYRHLVENLSDVIFTVDRDGFITYVSLAGERLFGYGPDDLLKKPFTEIVYYEDIPALSKRFSEIGQGIIRPFEWRLMHKDGNHSWVRTSTRPVPEGAGNSGFLGVISDISREKEAEKALRESEGKYRSLYHNSAIGIFHSSLEGRFIDVNPALAKMLGYASPDEVVNSVTSIPTQVYAEPPRYSTVTAAILDSGRIARVENRYLRRDGSLWYGMLHVRIVPDQQGKPAYYEGFVEDVTDRKKAEEAFNELSAYNRSLIEASLDPLVTISHEGKIQDVNAATEKVTGYARADLIGTDFSDYFTEPEKARKGYQRVFSESSVFDYPLEIRHRDGHTVPVLYNATIYKDPDGNVRGVFAAARDMTERKKAEEQRELLISELAQKNAELDRFTYTVSHDLKSPLLSLRAFLSLLEGDLKTGNSERVAQDIRRISESAEKLDTLITTLLTLSRSGRTIDRALPVPLAGLARKAAEELDAPLQQRGIALVIADNLPVVSGDRNRLLQVMTNLLDNAIKFMGDQKEPRIEIGVQEEAGSPAIFIRDNGCGIDPANLPKVFGLFERFNPEIPGTGIGLATVKRIIEAHGGKIRVESEGPGKGTTFFFTLP